MSFSARNIVAPDRNFRQYATELAAGETALEGLNLDDAKQHFDRAIQCSPSRASLAHGYRAYCVFPSNRTQALEEFQQALAAEPEYGAENAVILTLRAKCYLRTQEFDKAESDLSKAIEFLPKEFTAFVLRGKLRCVQKRFDEALPDLEKACVLNPENQEGNAWLGLCLLEKGRPQDALSHLSDSVQRESSERDYLLTRGRAHLALKKYPEANDDLSQYLRCTPGSADGHYYKGLALAEIGDLRAAIYQLQTCVDMMPDGPAGQKLRETATTLAARSEEQLKKNPENAWANVDMATALSTLGDSKKSGDFADKAVRIAPKDSTILFIAGSCHRLGGNYEKATAYLKQAVEINPRDDNSMFNLGWAYLAQGSNQKVVDTYTKYLESFDKAKGAAYLNRALAFENLGDNQRALTDYENCLRESPGDSRALAYRGNVWYSLGKSDNAIKDLNDAISRNPKLYYAYNRLAEILEETGDMRGACAIRRKAISQFVKLDDEKAFYLHRKCADAEICFGELDKAEKEYKKILKMKGLSTAQRVDALWGMAAIYAGYGKPDEAEKYIRASMELDTNNEALVGSLEPFHIVARKYDDALSDYCAFRDGYRSKKTGWYLYYGALFPWIALNEKGADQDARNLLMSAYNEASREEWPAPIVGFLLDKVSADELRRGAKTNAVKFEVEFYTAAKALYSGDLASAHRHMALLKKQPSLSDEFIVASEICNRYKW